MTIGIEYDEFSKTVDMGYRYVYIFHKNERINYNSGNLIKDWFDAINYYIDNSDSESLTYSSTVDNFFMDGCLKRFSIGYIVHIKGKRTLKYTKKYSDNLEFFVPKGTKPTYEELVEYCK